MAGRACQWVPLRVEYGHGSGPGGAVGRVRDPGPAVAVVERDAERQARGGQAGGNGLGMHNLGMTLLSGRGLATDDGEAFRWMRKGADAGCAEATATLSWMYLNGRGVARDDAQAFAWARRAAESWSPAGVFMLSQMYLLGVGVPADEAIRQIRRLRPGSVETRAQVAAISAFARQQSRRAPASPRARSASSG